MKDFRPISLCNVTYKLVSKILANTLKPILHKVVGETQRAFVSNRLIIDNILVASEVFELLNCSHKGQALGAYAVKIDMTKAYDRMKWNYVEWMLEKMNFPSCMVQLIITCISTIKFRILVNGEPSGQFQPSRGIRQGDPLSPYLFILCVRVSLQ